MPVSAEQAESVQRDIERLIDDLRAAREIVYSYAHLQDDKRGQHALEMEGLLLRLVETCEGFTATIYKAASEAIDSTRTLDERRQWVGFLRDRW